MRATTKTDSHPAGSLWRIGQETAAGPNAPWTCMLSPQVGPPAVDPFSMKKV
jgi:hypothetical protein